MNDYRPQPPARAFFLDAAPGKRFCLYHAPAPDRECRGAILYVHPFGDEMNMARRMAAIQARAFAARGFAVLQPDLYGCGDSSGELRDATWETWQRDLHVAADWLRTHASPAISLWGLRLGATLALDMARSVDLRVERCILWQPVVAGSAYITQFLRMRLAADMMTADGKAGSTQSLREALQRGEAVEVGGYELSPALVADIDRIDLAGLHGSAFSLHWFDLVSDAQASIPAARQSVARAWMDRNIDLRLHAVAGPAFWGTKEVCECPALVAATVDLFAEEAA